MNIEELRDYCITKKGVSESFPFDEETLVFKVMNKMFLLTNINKELSMNVKCDPEKAIELREKYSFVLPGWHMNKRLWNTVNIEGSISDQQIKEWIDDSYNLIVTSLTKKLQNELLSM
ncbi:MmcQ/YjbR family DNA-binding protein [Ancylomarina sp. 16SWW S1-10-2]|uniref:MmcQ/YjbR family DNA-binding protein n=1 Tax=Ancylomarina sp. 16SWW S1-10-2 TaxID=2499681 RepID=UPI0012AE5F53|nr:MmcQ/YjbR family DNA-binding protein [Ancylomarina sp. 16SWW S1-10-2]MRT92470.1 MmcQ/YjbR family DNA-binding protein [Ancylomarina sp. 16SWW S1-10-2]